MPTIQVLMDATGSILGTALLRDHVDSQDGRVPVVRIVAHGGQRVVDVPVTDAELGLDPDSLLARLKERRLL